MKEQQTFFVITHENENKEVEYVGVKTALYDALRHINYKFGKHVEHKKTDTHLELIKKSDERNSDSYVDIYKESLLAENLVYTIMYEIKGEKPRYMGSAASPEEALELVKDLLPTHALCTVLTRDKKTRVYTGTHTRSALYIHEEELF